MPERFDFDLFLSHSSADKPIVRPLAQRLRAEGFRVWFDEWQIRPGDSIPAKIDEGLEQSRVLVLCMSEHALGSDWSQLEAGTFRFRDPLNRTRRFLPLRLDGSPIKGSLAQFLYIDWRSNQDQAFSKLISACRDECSPVAPRVREDKTAQHDLAAGNLAQPPLFPYLNMAPPLPPHYVARESLTTRVIEPLRGGAVSDTVNQPRASVVALHGLPGGGKSTLAAAVCARRDLHHLFPDGILWITLGQEPDILALMRDLVAALGENATSFTTLDAASGYFRGCLRPRQLLLVLDDVWDHDHVFPFLSSGLSRTLVTSREAAMVTDLGALAIEVDVLEAAEASLLLENKARFALEPAKSSQIVERLERLPLAVELAGAQLSDGISVDQLLDQLQTEMMRLEALDRLASAGASSPAVRKRLSLRACFHLSIGRLPSHEVQAFAWLGVLPEDVEITPRMLTTIWDAETAPTAQNILRHLANHALLQQGRKVETERSYRMHDLLHDQARDLLTRKPQLAGDWEVPSLGMDFVEAHRTVLRRYRKRSSTGDWDGVPDDGYFHRHLLWHLERASQVQEIHTALLSSNSAGRNSWYDANQKVGRLSGMAIDTRKAWSLIHGDMNGNSLSLCFDYALVLASLNSLARNIPHELLEELVAHGIWTFAQAKAYVHGIDDARLRVEGLVSIVAAGGSADDELSLVTEAIALMRAHDIKDPSATIAIWARRAQRSSLSREVWQRFWQYANSLAGSDVTHSTLALLPLARPETAASAAKDLLKRIVNLKSASFDHLVALAPHLEPESAARVVSSAVAMVQKARDRAETIEQLGRTLEHLPPKAANEQRNKIWRIASGISDHRKELRAEAYISAIRFDPGAAQNLFAMACDAALTTKGPKYICRLAAVVSPPRLAELVPEVIQRLKATKGADPRWNCLLPVLSQPLGPHDAFLELASETAKEITNRDLRIAAMAIVLRYLPDPARNTMLEGALTFATRIGDNSRRLLLDCALAPFVESKDRKKTLQAAMKSLRGIRDEHIRKSALVQLATYVSEELLEFALEIAEGIRDGALKHDALVSVGRLLPRDRRAALWRQLAPESWMIKYEWIDPLSPDECRAAWNYVLRSIHLSIDDRQLERISSNLSAEIRASIWRKAVAERNMVEPNDLGYGMALFRMIKMAPPECWKEARGLVDALDGRFRDDANARLVGNAPLGMEAEALNLSEKVYGAEEKTVAYKRFFERALSAEQRQNAHRTIIAFARQAESFRKAEYLVVTSQFVSDDNRAALLSEALGLFEVSTRTSYYDVMRIVATLRAQDPQTVLERVARLCLRCRDCDLLTWRSPTGFLRLADLLTGPFRAKIIEHFFQLISSGEPESRARVLIDALKLSSDESSDQLVEAFVGVISAIKATDRQVDMVLEALRETKHAKQKLATLAVELTNTITDGMSRSLRLARCVEHVQADLQKPVAEAALAVFDSGTTIEWQITELIERCGSVQWTAALNAAFRIVDPSARAEAVATLGVVNAHDRQLTPEQWRGMLWCLASTARGSCVESLTMLAPVIGNIRHGEENRSLASDLQGAVSKAASWWP